MKKVKGEQPKPVKEAVNPPPSPPAEEQVLTWQTVLLLFVTALAVTLGTALLVMNLAVRGSTGTVPAVTGRTVSQAAKELSRNGFLLKQATMEFNESIPAGYIISQNPAAGAPLKKGRVIFVQVSSGPALVNVPDLAGKPVREAEIVIKQNRLRVGEAVKIDSTVPAGSVIAQRPEGGSKRNRDTVVQLLVSNGPAPRQFLMPDLTNRKWPDIHDMLKDRMLYIGRVSVEARGDLEKRTILAQMPRFGEMIAEGSYIALRAATTAGRADANFVTVQYPVPQEGKEKRVRLIIVDDHGSREIFNDMARSGDQVSVQVGVYGQALLQILVNNEIVEERWVS